MYGKVWFNIRFYSYHLTIWSRFPFVQVKSNVVHRKGSGLDPVSKLQIGEFRNQPGWRRFQVYKFFGRVTHG